MTVLCLVETDAGGAADASLRALVVARELAGRRARTLGGGLVRAGGGGGRCRPGSCRGVVGVGDRVGRAVWLRAAGLGQGAGGAVVAAMLGRSPLSSRRPPTTATRCSPTSAAISDLPMAANCVSASVTAPGQFALVRQRWAGSLLEDAVLEAPMAVLTVAADAIAAEQVAAGAGERGPGDVRVEQYEPELAEARCPRAGRGVDRPEVGCLAGQRQGRGRRRARRRRT